MNYNQLLLKEALTKGLHDALFTHNKYREILDVCLAALDEPAQASEPTQAGLNKEKGILDEMHEYPSGPMYTIKLKDNAKSKSLVDKLFKIWDKEKSNLAFEPVLPVRSHVYPDAGRIEIEPTEEAAKKILEDSGYTVTKNSEPEKQLDEMYEQRFKFSVIQRKINEVSERINEIADKVNRLYPLVKRIDTDSHIIKSGLGLKGVKPGESKQASVNKTLDDYPLTKRQLDQVADHLKSEIFKTIREDRLKGGFK